QRAGLGEARFGAGVVRLGRIVRPLPQVVLDARVGQGEVAVAAPSQAAAFRDAEEELTKELVGVVAEDPGPRRAGLDGAVGPVDADKIRIAAWLGRPDGEADPLVIP